MEKIRKVTKKNKEKNIDVQTDRLQMISYREKKVQEEKYDKQKSRKFIHMHLHFVYYSLTNRLKDIILKESKLIDLRNLCK